MVSGTKSMRQQVVSELEILDHRFQLLTRGEGLVDTFGNESDSL